MELTSILPDLCVNLCLRMSVFFLGADSRSLKTFFESYSNCNVFYYTSDAPARQKEAHLWKCFVIARTAATALIDATVRFVHRLERKKFSPYSRADCPGPLTYSVISRKHRIPYVPIKPAFLTNPGTCMIWGGGHPVKWNYGEHANYGGHIQFWRAKIMGGQKAKPKGGPLCFAPPPIIRTDCCSTPIIVCAPHNSACPTHNFGSHIIHVPKPCTTDP